MTDYSSALHLAAEAYRANLSPRAKRLDTLEAYARTDQYQGRPNFWADDKPLLDRAPCIVHTLVESAIRSHASMVVGEGRFPKLTTHGDEDTDDDFGLSKADSAILDPFIKSLVRRVKLRPIARRAMESALSCGTAVCVVSARNNHLTVDTIPAKRCAPTFDETGKLRRVEVRYPYIREIDRGRLGTPDVIAEFYRRVIDEKSDVVYRPVRANRSGVYMDDQWAEQSRVDHNLGVCPVIWYKHGAEEATPAEVDGRALHALLLQQIFHLDLSRSQLHRAVVQTLDPILAEIGVPPGHQPAPLGNGPRLLDGGMPDPVHMQWGVAPPQVTMGRKRAPGMAYQYPQGAVVDYLTVPGDTFEAAFKNSADLMSMICEALHWRPDDPAMLQANALSGRALEWLHKRQIDFDVELRTDVGDHLILPLVDMLLRVARTIAKSGRTILIPGLAKALPVLDRFEVQQRRALDSEETDLVWVPPEIDIVWGPFFPPTEADQKAIGDNVRADVEAGLITKRTAVETYAQRGFYAIGDVDKYVEALEKADADKMTALHEANAVLDGAVGEKPAPGEDPAAEGEREPAESAPAQSQVKPRVAAAKPPTVALPKGRLLGGRRVAA